MRVIYDSILSGTLRWRRRRQEFGGRVVGRVGLEWADFGANRGDSTARDGRRMGAPLADLED